MRRLLLAAVADLVAQYSAGCFIPAYSGDPQRRAQQLLNTSDDFRRFSTSGSGSGSWISPRTCRFTARMAVFL